MGGRQSGLAPEDIDDLQKCSYCTYQLSSFNRIINLFKSVPRRSSTFTCDLKDWIGQNRGH